MSFGSKRSTDIMPIDASMKELVKIWNQGAYSKLLVLCDDHTEEHCFPILSKVLNEAEIKANLITVESGENHKTLESAVLIWNRMTELAADRKALLLNLGGGMICDLGAFVASLYKRGIDFIHLPTSVLAMVDASIGGKNGVDLDSHKNIIGSFKSARAIFLHFPFLKTLPDQEFISGLAEVHKHALIADNWLWQELKHLKAIDIDQELVLKAAKIKQKIIDKDPFEKDKRKLLNFGHSIGHGIESYFLSIGTSLSHGNAIAAGMICESYISYKRSFLKKGDFEEVIEWLDAFYPRLVLSSDSSWKIIDFMRNDKKNRDGKFLFVMLNSIGQAEYDQEVSEKEINDALNFYMNEL